MGGRFDLVRVLGSGAMGIVHEAMDLERGRTVALKTLSAFDADSIYRIKREFRSLAGVRHPNLVKLLELGVDEGRWFIAMELVEGVDFLAHVRPALTAAPVRSTIDEATEVDPDVHVEEEVTEAVLPGPPAFDEPRLRAALGQLVQGVAAIHAAGRLHRDLKPSNVLVDKTGRVVVLDFGLATDLWEAAILRSTRGQGKIFGTIAYMSPEQAAGNELGPPSDWYAVGVMLYEALTGKLPLVGAPVAVLLDKQRKDPMPVSALAPAAPPDLAALAMSLLARVPGERPSAAAILEQLGLARPTTGTFEVRRAPFVGRAEEMAALHEAFAACRGGSLVLVEGPAGYGKTTIVQQFLDEIAGSNPRPLVLFGRCYAEERLPYKAVDALVDGLVRHLRRQPPHRVDNLFGPEARPLARLFPVLRRLPSLAGAEGDTALGPPEELRRRAFRALAVALGRLAAERPLVVVVEDLQFGDLDSARLFAALVGPPEPVPLLLVGTSLAGEPVARSIAGRVGRSAALSGLPVRRLSLGPLDRDASKLLAQALLESAGIQGAAAQAEWIADEARGDPRLLEALAAAGRAQVESTRGQADRLAGLLVARVQELGQAERRALEVLAVATGTIPTAVLLDAAGLASDALLVVRTLVETRLAGRGPGEIGVEVASERLRSTVLEGMDPRVRAARHAALVRAMLAAESTVEPRVLIHHLRAAGDESRAARVALSAAEEAFSALAFEKAAELYQICLDLADAGSVVEWSLLERLGTCLASAGRGRAAADAFLEAARVARPAQVPELERRAAEQLLGAGHFEEGTAALRRVLASVGLSWPKSHHSALRAAAVQRLQLKMRGLSFATKSEVDPVERLRLDVCWTAGTGLALFDLPRSVYFAGRLLQIAVGAGDLERLVRALAAEALLAGGARRSGTYHRRLTAALREAAELAGGAYAEALVLFSSGFSAYLRGKWREGERSLTTALDIFTSACPGAAWEIHTARLMRLEALSWQGRLRDLPEDLAAARAVAEETGNLYALTTLRVCPRLSILHLAADHPDRLEREVRAALADWPDQGFHVANLYALESETLAELYRGNAAAAHERVEAAWATLAGSGLFRVALIGFEAWSLRGRAALAAGATDRGARPVVEASISALRDMRVPGAKVESLLLRAQQAAVRGRRHEALGLFSEAESAADAAGQGLHAAASRLGAAVLSGDHSAKAATERKLAAEGIRAPERFAALWAPALLVLSQRAQAG